MTHLKGEGLAELPEGRFRILDEGWFEVSTTFLSREFVVQRMRDLQEYLDSAEDVIEQPAEQRAWVERLIQGYREQAELHRRWQGQVSVTPPPLDKGGFYRMKEEERAQFLDRTAELLELGLAGEGPLPLILHCQETWTQRLEFFGATLAELDGGVYTTDES